MFQDGLDMIRMFGAYGDLVTLAGYRRQVRNLYGVFWIDLQIVRLTRRGFRKRLISIDEVYMIEERMPPFARRTMRLSERVKTWERLLAAGRYGPLLVRLRFLEWFPSRWFLSQNKGGAVSTEVEMPIVQEVGD